MLNHMLHIKHQPCIVLDYSKPSNLAIHLSKPSQPW